MPNARERHMKDTFGLSLTEALAAAIFSTLRALLCLTDTGTFCTMPVDSNFSTIRKLLQRPCLKTLYNNVVISGDFNCTILSDNSLSNDMS